VISVHFSFSENYFFDIKVAIKHLIDPAKISIDMLNQTLKSLFCLIDSLAMEDRFIFITAERILICGYFWLIGLPLSGSTEVRMTL